MYCSQCATQLGLDDVYCPNCAKPVASFAFDERQIPQVEYIGETPTVVRPKPQNVKSSKVRLLGGGRGFAFTIVFLFLLGALAILGYLAFIKPQANNEATTQTPPTVKKGVKNPAPTLTPELPTSLPPTPEPTSIPAKPKILIVNAVFPVNARQIEMFTFETSGYANVTGGFRTYGGSNDIDAYVVDEVNYERLVQSNSFQSIYTRLKADRGKIDVTVPAGRYFVVFSNRHALLTGKQVAAEVYYQEQ